MIVGHCRFSWVGFSDTGRLASDIERAKIELWNPMRMAIRFWLFEQVLLPSLDTQIDQGFVVSLLISVDLPQKYRDRLEAIVQERHFAFMRQQKKILMKLCASKFLPHSWMGTKRSIFALTTMML